MDWFVQNELSSLLVVTVVDSVAMLCMYLLCCFGHCRLPVCACLVDAVIALADLIDGVLTGCCPSRYVSLDVAVPAHCEICVVK